MFIITYLSASFNKLSALPPEIGNLSSLQTLFVYQNQLSALPPEIGDLSSLINLDIGRNRLSLLPIEIGYLSNLKHFHVDQNQLNNLPTEIGNLSNLYTLSVPYNQLSALPSEIGNLSNLYTLDAYVNNLNGLPAEVGNLTNLLVLRIYGNQLNSLPNGISNLTRLRDFKINNNPNLSGSLPLGLQNNAGMTHFYFNNTQLCEPQDADFQAWLGGVSNVQDSGIACEITCSAGQFKAEYFNNQNLEGQPVYVQCENGTGINYGGTPDYGTGADDFSVRWTGMITFTEGEYIFDPVSDDGMRMWIDDTLIVDEWHDQGLTMYQFTRTMMTGQHAIKVEYFDNTANNLIILNWTENNKVSTTCPASVGQLCAEYYDNHHLNGTPVYTRIETLPISYTWEGNSPHASVPINHFSTRWQGNLIFTSGVHTFTATSDDGIRMWIDGELVLDGWDGYSTIGRTNAIILTAGIHAIEIQYYEYGGSAYIQIDGLPTNNLVAYYPFNGNSNDESGNDYHATNHGGVTLAIDRFGNADSAYTFDGVDGWMGMDSLTNTFQTGDAFSFVGWFKTNHTPDIVHSNILFAVNDKSQTTSNLQNMFRIGTGKNGGIYLSNGNADPEYASGFNDDTWHFLSVMIDGNNTLTATVDMQTVANIPNFQISWNSAKQYSFGQEWDTNVTSEYWHGGLDDIRLYNRVLSLDEIQAMHESTIPKLINGDAETNASTPWESFILDLTTSDDSHASNHAFHAKVRDGHPVGSIGQTVSGFISGTTVYVRAWVKATTLGTTSIKLIGHNNDNWGNMHDPYIEFIPYTDTWTEVILPYTVDETGNLRVAFYMEGSTPILIDDIQISTNSNLDIYPTSVINGDFEQGLGGWYIEGGANGIIRLDEGYNSLYSFYSEQARTTEHDPAWRGIRYHLSVNELERYKIRAMLKWKDAVNVHVKVRWFDANDDYVPGQQYPMSMNDLGDGNSNGWVERWGWVKAPATATKVELIFWHGMDNHQNVTGSKLWVDDVTFEAEPMPMRTLVNGDFESGTQSPMEYWHANIALTTTSHTGDFGITIIKPSEYEYGATGHDVIGLTQGEKVYFTTWVKATSVNTTTMRLRTHNNAELSNHTEKYVPLADTWTQVVLPHTVDSSDKLRAIIDVFGNDAIVADDLQIHFTRPMSYPTTMLNGDFELGMGGFFIFGDVETDISHDGSTALKTTQTFTSGEAHHWSGISKFVMVIPTVTYDFRAMLKSQDATQLHMKTEWFDENGQSISWSSQMSGTDGSFDWSWRGGEVEAPANAKYAHIVIWHGVINNATNVHGGVVWVDDVRFEPYFNTVQVNDESGMPMANAQVYLNGTDVYTTDVNGMVEVMGMQAGDTLVARIMIEEVASPRRPGDWAHRVYLTSLDIPKDTEPVPYLVTDTSITQTLTVKQDNVLLGFNIVIALEWDATETQINDIEMGFDEANRYLYDVLNGQALFEKISIVDRRQNKQNHHDLWLSADYRFKVRNDLDALTLSGDLIPMGITATTDIELEAVYIGSHFGRNLRDETDNRNFVNSLAYTALTHEFGHYGFSLYDAYEYTEVVHACLAEIDPETGDDMLDENGQPVCQTDQNGQPILLYYDPPDNTLPVVYETSIDGRCTSPNILNNGDESIEENASIMFDERFASELSMRVEGDPTLWESYCENTEQYRLTGRSDWEQVEHMYSDTRWTWKTPATYGGVVPGPKTVPVTQWSSTIIDNEAHPMACAVPKTIRIQYKDSDNQLQDAEGVPIYLRKGLSGAVIFQGYTKKEGRLTLLGASLGDFILVQNDDNVNYPSGSGHNFGSGSGHNFGSGSGHNFGSGSGHNFGINWNRLYYPRYVNCGTQVASKRQKTHADDDTMLLEPAPLNFDLTVQPMSNTHTIKVIIKPNVVLTTTLYAFIHQEGNIEPISTTLSYESTSNTYFAIVALDQNLSKTGMLEAMTILNDNPIMMYLNFDLQPIQPGSSNRIVSSDGNLRLSISGNNVVGDGVVAISNARVFVEEPPLREVILNGPYHIQSSSTLTMQGIANLQLSISDMDSRLEDIDFSTARIHHWDEYAQVWQPLATHINLNKNIAQTQVSDFGIYAFIAKIKPAVLTLTTKIPGGLVITGAFEVDPLIGTHVFTDLLPGIYHTKIVNDDILTLSEWKLRVIECQSPNEPSFMTEINLQDYTFEIPVKLGQALTCNFFKVTLNDEIYNDYHIFIPIILKY
ncbi:MAG: hypothetical protein B6242_11570 [Anaerolineaceae bacterium 4572_78]|nr:MAG: hypothetical protein B6242_11570 [Anaerolineaceae bacterium 4572_78]